MSKFSCECKTSCTAITVAVSVILGIITALLTVTGNFVVTPALLWAAAGVALVYIAVALIAAAGTGCSQIRECICSALAVLLTGALGTVLTAVILLTIDIAATSVIGAIITGLLVLFFSLTLGSTACLARCIAGCSE